MEVSHNLLILLTVIITAAFSLSILYYLKPDWIQKINKNTGQKELSWMMLSLYSLLFGLLAGVFVLLYCKDYAKKPKKVNKRFSQFASE